MKDNETPNLPAEIKSKAIDYVTSGAKALVGAAPFIGPLLAELAGTVIPNQRIERITKFAALLESRITNMEQNLLHDAFKDEEFTELLEEALHQAARSTSEERRKYLASLVANSLTSDAIEHNESKHLLRILVARPPKTVVLEMLVLPGTKNNPGGQDEGQAIQRRADHWDIEAA